MPGNTVNFVYAAAMLSPQFMRALGITVAIQAM